MQTNDIYNLRFRFKFNKIVSRAAIAQNDSDHLENSHSFVNSDEDIETETNAETKNAHRSWTLL